MQYTPLVPALRRWKQVDLYRFKASLIYIESYKPARTTQLDPVKNNKVGSYKDS